MPPTYDAAMVRGTAPGQGNELSLQADLREAAHFPAGHAQALVDPRHVRGAEVHALPDASVDDVVVDRLPVGVGAGDAERVRAGQRYGGRRSRADEGIQDTLLRAGLAAVAAGYSGCCGAAQNDVQVGSTSVCSAVRAELVAPMYSTSASS